MDVFCYEKSYYFLLLTLFRCKRAKIWLLLVILSEINADGLKVLISVALAVQSGPRSFLQWGNDFILKVLTCHFWILKQKLDSLIIRLILL